MTEQTEQTEQTRARPRPRLRHGYLGATLDRILDCRPVATRAEVLLTVPRTWRKSSQAVSLSSFIAANPRRYFSPFAGVICRVGREARWVDVAAAVDPLYGEVLSNLDPTYGASPQRLAQESRSRHVTVQAVRSALRWLEARGLAYASGRYWGLTAKAAAPVDPGPYVQAAIDKRRLQDMLS